MSVENLKEIVLKDGKYTCFHRIKELTKKEYVAVGNDGQIFRWSPTGGNEQKWLIFPVDGEGYCNIVTLQNGECMAVGSNGNIRRWAKTGGKEQKFKFVNKNKQDGSYNLREKTKNEYVAVGHAGNIFRWAQSGKNDQKFILEPIGEKMPQDDPAFSPSPEKPAYPPIHGLMESLPGQSPKCQIGVERLASVFVNDPNYTNKVLQVTKQPYYYLVRRQYWEKVYDKKLVPGVENRVEVTVRVGTSSTETNEIETTIGVAVSLSGKIGIGKTPKDGKGGVKVGVSGKLSTQVSWQRRELSKTEHKQEQYIERKEGYIVSQESECRIVAWQIVDEYSLYTHEKERLNRWAVYGKRIDWTKFPEQS